MSTNQLTHAQRFRGQNPASLYRKRCKVKFLKSALLVTLPSPATQPLSTAHKEQHAFAFNWYPVDCVLGLWTLSRCPYFRKKTEQREQTWRHPRIRRRLGQGVHLLPVEVVIVRLTIPTRAVRLIKEAATYGGTKRGESVTARSLNWSEMHQEDIKLSRIWQFCLGPVDLTPFIILPNTPEY